MLGFGNAQEAAANIFVIVTKLYPFAANMD